MLPLTVVITMVRAAAARNASPSMEIGKPASISQILPLPTGCWHPRDLPYSRGPILNINFRRFQFSSMQPTMKIF